MAAGTLPQSPFSYSSLPSTTGRRRITAGSEHSLRMSPGATMATSTTPSTDTIAFPRELSQRCLRPGRSELCPSLRLQVGAQGHPQALAVHRRRRHVWAAAAAARQIRDRHRFCRVRCSPRRVLWTDETARRRRVESLAQGPSRGRGRGRSRSRGLEVETGWNRCLRPSCGRSWPTCSCVTVFS